MIKAVFFDAAGVLYQRSGHTMEFAETLLHKCGYHMEISCEEEEVLKEMRGKANKGKIGHEVYWHQFLMFKGVNKKDQREHLYHQIIAYSNDVQPMPGAKEALEMLKLKGILLGVITDTMYPLDWKVGRLEKAGVANLITLIACSTDLGIHKPDPLVYQYAVKQTHFSAEQCAFVGHLDSELQGAHSIGMLTIAVNHEADVSADYFCTAMSDLPRLPIFS